MLASTKNKAGQFLVLLAAAPSTAAWQPPVYSGTPKSAPTVALSAIHKEEWSVADDWDALSAENPRNSAPDGRDIFNQNIGDKAVQSILPDNHGDAIEKWSPEDQWLHDVIDQFLNPLSSSPLYDTKAVEPSSSSSSKQTSDWLNRNFEDQMGDEIAMLVRCNESPEDMLVRAGRAVPELTQEHKFDASQLVEWKESVNDTTGYWQATPFLLQAVERIFIAHAKMEDGEPEAAMDAKAVSGWMTKCLGNELDYYGKRTSGKDMMSHQRKRGVKIGPHDSRVLKLISKFGNYGTGKLTLENFQNLYLDALTHMDTGMELQGSVETLHLRNPDHIQQVWRDLNNHGIISPHEQRWKEANAELQAKYGSLQQQAEKILEQGNLMDECEILDYTYDPPPTTQQIADGYDAKNHKYIRRSSHESISLASDNKTPLYMEDGDFVFIDEESCIGCMQCVNVAPSSFLMMESGRARTFHQRKGADVGQGVAACPVNCMHRVSFDELKELETVRDKGDGRSDHRHMGHQRGYTPLHVARRGTDNNHRSSWYHYMKNKCCSSGQCPQRGCFDCPSYRSPGDNPYFQEKTKAAQHVRAQHFTDSGAADMWRKAADL